MDIEHDQVETDNRGIDGTTRRALLGAAASGLALAVGGLFLHELAEDAEARNGANGGKLGGRRGKNRRGHDKHKHRTNKNKRKDRQKAPGRGPFDYRDTALTVTNNTGKPLTAQFYFQRRGDGDNYGAPIASELATIEPGQHKWFDFEFRCGVNIKDIEAGVGIDANVRNMTTAFPRGEVRSGTNVALGGDGGTPLVGQQGFFVNESHFGRLNGNGTKVLLQRNPDTQNWIEFELIIGG
jgi:hypothetical protein